MSGLPSPAELQQTVSALLASPQHGVAAAVLALVTQLAATKQLGGVMTRDTGTQTELPHPRPDPDPPAGQDDEGMEPNNEDEVEMATLANTLPPRHTRQLYRFDPYCSRPLARANWRSRSRSRSQSRSPSSRRRSRSRSSSSRRRSPSIRRRSSSPSFLETRRITSARRLPVPYTCSRARRRSRSRGRSRGSPCRGRTRSRGSPCRITT